MSKETTHCVSCIAVVSGLNMSFITNNRLIFSHYETLNDWNRILSRYFRKCTCFQKGLVILFFELKLYLCPDLCWHCEHVIINWCSSVSICQPLELSFRAINFFWNRLNRGTLQHVHELTWFNIDSAWTLHRNCSTSYDCRRLLFLVFHYWEIVYEFILTLIASLRSYSPNWWRSRLDNFVFLNVAENLLNHFVKFLKFLFGRSARFLRCLCFNDWLSFLSGSRVACMGLRFLYTKG